MVKRFIDCMPQGQTGETYYEDKTCDTNDKNVPSKFCSMPGALKKKSWAYSVEVRVIF